MHIIVGGGALTPRNLGGKGFNLLKLDRLGFTPDFAVIPAAALSAAARRDPLLRAWLADPGRAPAAAADRLRALRPPPGLLRGLRAAVKKLGPGPLIYRSSFSAEDSSARSYAGLFRSLRRPGPADPFGPVREIWAATFGRDALAYGGGLAGGGMAVVIQKFIKPDFSGVCFLGPAGDFYAEYCAGSSDAVELGKALPAAWLSRGGETYSSLPDPEAHAGWLGELERRVRALRPGGGPGLDVEFAVAGGAVSLLQSRPLTAAFDPGARRYAYPCPASCSCHPGDFSAPAFRAALRGLGLPAPAEIPVTPAGARLRGADLFRLDDEIARRALDPRFLALFREKFYAFLLAESAAAGRAGAGSVPELFKALKLLNFKMALLDRIHVRLQKTLEREFAGRYGGRWLRERLGDLLPERSFTAGRLAARGEGGVPLFYKAGRAALVGRAAAGLAALGGGAGPRRGPALTGFAARFAPRLRELVDLREKVDYYYAQVTAVYHKHISVRTRYNGDISKACRLPAGDIPALLQGRLKAPRRARLVPAPAPAFPLEGAVACAGSAEGRAAVIRKFSDIRKVKKGDILVARYTRPDLFAGMLLAGGIVTAEGGLTSHAAIVSRELGKPCLVGVAGCLEAVRDGDTLRIRGGRVFRVKGV